jgi:hypothetical protein
MLLYSAALPLSCKTLNYVVWSQGASSWHCPERYLTRFS